MAAANRELLWGLRAVAGEVDAWRARAATTPDKRIREDALGSLARKRPHLDGAALFWTLPRRRNRHLLRLLVAYEIALEFLDEVNERAVYAGQTNGRQLHLALAHAVDLDAITLDYYRHHPWKDDGGYLRAIVDGCRAWCARLPSYTNIRSLLIREATRTQVLALNHERDPILREAALRAWAGKELPEIARVSWFELSGAATASLTVHALLALAAEPQCTESDIEGTQAVYFPWLSLTTTMLDSYVDRAEDMVRADHSYVEHYGDLEIAIERIGELISRSIREARRLRSGHRHIVIAASMIAMYLSRDSAREAESSQMTQRLVRAGGSSVRLLLPILRMWRVVCALCSD